MPDSWDFFLLYMLSIFRLLLFIGADIVGLNCNFDPDLCLKGMAMGKKALEDAGIERHLIVQPLALWTPDCGKEGYYTLPEAFLGMKLS